MLWGLPRWNCPLIVSLVSEALLVTVVGETPTKCVQAICVFILQLLYMFGECSWFTKFVVILLLPRCLKSAAHLLNCVGMKLHGLFSSVELRCWIEAAAVRSLAYVFDPWYELLANVPLGCLRPYLTLLDYARPPTNPLVAEVLDKLVAQLPLVKVDPLPVVANRHDNAAKERAEVERAVIRALPGDVLLAAYRGSLKRYRTLGLRCHICLDPLHAMDASRHQAHVGPHHPNDVQVHGLDECDIQSHIRLFVHVDYELPVEKMCDSIIRSGMGIIITHDFHNMAREGKLWSGEAEYVKFDGTVTMKHSGSIYQHGYNQWLPEGFMRGSLGVCHYRRIAVVGATSVIAVYPTGGRFDASSVWLTKAPATQGIRLGDQLFKFDDRMVGSKMEKVLVSGDHVVPFTPIAHVALQMVTTPVTDTFEASILSRVDNYWRSNDYDRTVMSVAVQLVVALRDRYLMDFAFIRPRFDLSRIFEWGSIYRRVYLWWYNHSLRQRQFRVPWLFPVVHVPAYSAKAVPRVVSTDCSLKLSVPRVRPFPSQGAVPATSSDVRSCDSPAGESGYGSGFSSHKGHQPCPGPVIQTPFLPTRFLTRPAQLFPSGDRDSAADVHSVGSQVSRAEKTSTQGSVCQSGVVSVQAGQNRFQLHQGGSHRGIERSPEYFFEDGSLYSFGGHAHRRRRKASSRCSVPCQGTGSRWKRKTD